MRLLKIISVGVLGFLIGLGMWKLGSTGAGESWKQLPMPPQRVTELIPFGEPPLYIRTSDGKTYTYSDWHDEGWLEQAIPQPAPNPVDITRPCDHSFPEFSLSSNAPRDIADCVQETTWYADGHIKYAFVLDSKGRIWEWQHTSSPQDLTALLCLPLLGLGVGGCVAFIATAR